MAEKRIAALAPALRVLWSQFQAATARLLAQSQQAEKAFAFGCVPPGLARLTCL